MKKITTQPAPFWRDLVEEKSRRSNEASGTFCANNTIVKGEWVEDESKIMRQPTPHATSNSSLDDHEKLELQECYTAIRSFLDRRTQFVVFFGTATLTLLGLAIRYQNSTMVVAAGLVLIGFIVVDTMHRGNIASYIYTSYCIENKKLGKARLIYFHILSHLGGLKTLKALDNLYTIEDKKEFSKKLRSLFSNPFGFRARLVSALVLIAAIILIIFGIVMQQLNMHSRI